MTAIHCWNTAGVTRPEIQNSVNSTHVMPQSKARHVFDKSTYIVSITRHYLPAHSLSQPITTLSMQLYVYPPHIPIMYDVDAIASEPVPELPAYLT